MNHKEIVRKDADGINLALGKDYWRVLMQTIMNLTRP
jgi:hypothetical protein